MKTWLKHRVYTLAALAALLILIQCANTLFGGRLATLGILPRSLDGLWGIPLAPFIHGDWRHLFSNLPILLFLSALLMTHSIRDYLFSSLTIIFIGGLLVWLFARPAYHIGASGWIFGLWALLLAQAITRRRLLDLLFALLVLVYYGSIAAGLLPSDPYISTESHIAGAAAGVLYAVFTKRRDRLKK
ncbi:rhomboid family intramembrane serine protease [Leminorella grimontii]|uniref:Rhomboid family intramembrane serine protease n=1 Tax=Leminorella grimontii TaxID=82981 RepID=A0AAV5N2T5_9GAMM|nr:rhomboid family intramembrane serine protease [Leminorella grimontii]KFC96932.1 rhomboid family protein [Leminorella grimontii ATCC 33999 = DSM 5078]GKX56077.1 rhomboid family intramembrane serine protease [Leminorella grimontii]VFS57861.1 rhombosortase [Leminorella grimontii]